MANDRQFRLKPPPNPEQSIYEIGYRKPPAVTQFRPGRSGNPKGRPRGARNKVPALNEERLKTIVLEEAYRTIKVSEGRRQVTIPMAKAVVRALAVNAARGQLRSQQLFAALLSQTERANKALADKWLDVALEYKIQWDRELDRRACLGISGPGPIPHPDDIIIDVSTGLVRVQGPLTKEDKVKWDRMYGLLEESDRMIDELTEDMKLRKTKRPRQPIEDEIADLRRVRGMLVDVIGERKRRNDRSAYRVIPGARPVFLAKDAPGLPFSLARAEIVENDDALERRNRELLT